MQNRARIAYFSMEMGIENGMATYSGGLGLLAGDTVRAAADLKIPMLAVTLLHRSGYFFQKLEADGTQHEDPTIWPVDDFLEDLPQRAVITLEGRTVRLRAWKYEVTGIGGFTVPVYFLDADLGENGEYDRRLTDTLYGGDAYYRLCQEVILGIGGLRMLRALGYTDIERFHMNEGHASLLGLELLAESMESRKHSTVTDEDIDVVRKKCIFTTHTPVPTGQDQFPLDLAERVIGNHPMFESLKNKFCFQDSLNLTFLGLHFSHYINGVAKRHAEISRLMFAEYSIDSITNGVHAATWVSPVFQELFDRHIPGWRADNFSLRYALTISRRDIWMAHYESKKRLIRYINHETNAGMDQHVLTIGFARRATAYKRADLLFSDPGRLRSIAAKTGPFQIVFSGKAHPQDEAGKALIKHIFQAREMLKPDIRVAYLPNYDIGIARMMVAGADVWLNTPQPPLEASGTSGMKAAVNGVPSLSTLDGWWIEGCIEGITGWSIGDRESMSGERVQNSSDAKFLYEKLENTVIPLFYKKQDSYVDVMRHSIALNGSFFNAHRMIQQYVLNAYFL